MKRIHVVNLILLTLLFTGIVTAASAYREMNETTPNVSDPFRTSIMNSPKKFGILANDTQTNQTATGFPEGMRAISMSLAVGMSSIGAGYAVAHTGKAAIGSVTEKPELFGRTIIYVGLAEGIAIYGLLVSFLLWIGLAGG